MAVDPEIAFSQGDVMRRLRTLEQTVQRLAADRSLESAAVGAGGVRFHSGGGIRLQEGGSLSVEGGGDILVQGGRVIIQDADGAEIMRLSTDGLSLTGLLSVLGSIDVSGGGDITVTDGQIVVRDGNGDAVAQLGELPGGGRGVAAIDPSTSALVDLATLAFGLRAAVNTSVVTVESSTWDDPDSGDPGPTIDDLPVGSSGRCIVFLGASFGVVTIPDEQVGECQMSFEVSGASSVAPGLHRVTLGRQRSGTGGVDVGSGSYCNIAVLTGLTPGLHTIHAQYQVTGATVSGNINQATLVALPY